MPDGIIPHTGTSRNSGYRKYHNRAQIWRPRRKSGLTAGGQRDPSCPTRSMRPRRYRRASNVTRPAQPVRCAPRGYRRASNVTRPAQPVRCGPRGYRRASTRLVRPNLFYAARVATAGANVTRLAQPVRCGPRGYRRASNVTR